MRTWLLLISMLLLSGCTTVDPKSFAGRTIVNFSGANGTEIKGYYVQHGQRIAISQTVPWRLDGKGISSFQIKKVNSRSSVHLAMHYDGDGARVISNAVLGPSMHSMYVRVSRGFIVKTHSR